MTSEHSLDRVLKQIVEASRALVKARFAAIGVPDGEGGFEKFIVSGMTEKQWDAIGELPRQHGMLAAMLRTKEPYRTHDIRADPRFEGWPDAHPVMRSFLGVPLVSRDAVIGAFYLTEKREGRRRASFTQDDERLIVTLAAHAAVAIENARLFERSRELTVVEERNRLARDLHDAVNQTLFSLGLTAEATALLVDDDPAAARERLGEVQELARAAMEEMRSLIFELRPADVAADGLVGTLRKHVDVLQRVYGTRIDFDAADELAENGSRGRPALQREVFRIAQEAIANALKHADAREVRVRLALAGEHRLLLVVADDGKGFDPGAGATGRRLGLVSMRERAEALDAALTIDSAPGEGTTVALEVELA